MTSDNISLQLDNPTSSYSPGETIRGKVILNFDKEKETKCLSVNFRGEAKVYWPLNMEIMPPNVRLDSEKYFDTTCILREESKMKIQPGYQTYKFEFTLPVGIPSSFKGEHGLVSYLVTAVMQRDWKPDYTTFSLFTVNAIVDLKENPLVQKTIVVERYRKKMNCFCESGSVGFRFEIPKTGFVPGENVEMFAKLSNQSPKNVKKSHLLFVQEIVYHSGRLTRRHTISRVMAVGPKIIKGETVTWKGQIGKIPPVPPTKLGTCRIIDINYYVQLEMHLTGGDCVRGAAPIIIGTLPWKFNVPSLC